MGVGGGEVWRKNRALRQTSDVAAISIYSYFLLILLISINSILNISRLVVSLKKLKDRINRNQRIY